MMSSNRPAAPLRILLVEDDESHAELIRRGIEEQPDLVAQIDHVSDGEAALDYLFQSDGTIPDLILLDIRLPRVDGIEVLKRIRDSERSRLIPIVMLTTSEASDDIALAYRFRANSYLVKPLDFERFRNLAGKLGVYWGRWNERPS